MNLADIILFNAICSIYVCSGGFILIQYLSGKQVKDSYLVSGKLKG